LQRKSGLPSGDGRERGIDAARLQGKRFGRPEKAYPEDWGFWYGRYRKGELTRKYILEQMQITVDRFKYLQKKYERQKKGTKVGDT